MTTRRRRRIWAQRICAALMLYVAAAVLAHMIRHPMARPFENPLDTAVEALLWR